LRKIKPPAAAASEKRRARRVLAALPPAPVFGRPGTLVELPRTEPGPDEPPEEEPPPPPPPLPEEPLLPLVFVFGLTTVPLKVPPEDGATVPESELVPAGGVVAPVERVPVISEASAGAAESAKSAVAISVIDLFISVLLLLY